MSKILNSDESFYALVPLCTPLKVKSSTYKGNNENLINSNSYRQRLYSPNGGTASYNENLLKKSESFCQDVRKVLNFIGLTSNYDNFRRYDSVIDFRAFSRWISAPKKTALYHLENRRGMRVEIMGTPVVCAEDISECSEDDVRMMLQEQGKVFLRWW